MTGVQLSELHLGELLAEGGEGRVFDVVSAPSQLGRRRVYKQLRHPRPLPELSSLVAFPSCLAARDAALSGRVLASSAWPVSVVVGYDDPSLALGTVLPRAPSEFWVRHRDGSRRLATLSYLTNDPDRIAVAYGVMTPAPGAPERVALVYALARLLEAWQGQSRQGQSWQGQSPRPQVVHGDLSAKNVLWTLRPAPAVYVLDCDGASLGDESTAPGPDRRARAITPNWDDPALKRGDQPTAASDRYLLAIAFLRVVGAAHFPLQSRQRAVERVSVDLELPRSWRKLPDMPPLWELCERSLSLANAADRPTPTQWAAELEELLRILSALDLARAVRQAQGDPRPAGAGGPAGANRHDLPGVTVPDVVVRPVLRHRAPSTWQLISAGPRLDAPGGDGLLGLGGGRGAGAAPLTPRQIVARVITAWGGAHRAAARWVRSPGRRAYGVRRLAGVLVLDVAAACVGVFVVAMVISPWIGL